MVFKCRLCGSQMFYERPDYYECTGCSTFFKDKEKFSLNRVLGVQYLDHYVGDELKYQHLFDSGIDLYACIDEPVTLWPYRVDSENYKAKIPFGIKIEPSHYDMDVKIYPRSGLASKESIALANCVGVIDNTYKGELLGYFVNHGHIRYTINPGDRVAQMVVEKRLDVEIQTTTKLSDTERGEDGFGSTGDK